MNALQAETTDSSPGIDNGLKRFSSEPLETDRLCLKRISWPDALQKLAGVSAQRIAATTSEEVSKPSFCWEAIERSSRNFTGIISYSERSPRCAQVDLFFPFNPWSPSSLPIEALSTILNWGFSTSPEVQRIEMRCLSTAVTVKSILECLAVNFEGTNYAVVNFLENSADVDCYAMTRKIWQNGGTSDVHWKRRFNNDGGHI